MAHAEDHAGAHTRNAGDHVPHVLPLRVYIATWLALMALTVITVAASYVNLGHGGNLLVAIFIATIKASTVALLFMHLLFDHKFHSVILVSSLVFLGIFIGATLHETNTRGRAENIEAEHPAQMQKPFGGTIADEELKERYEGKKEGAHEEAPKHGEGH